MKTDLGRGTVQQGKAERVGHADTLQQQHGAGQVGPLDLGDRGLLHLALEPFLGVESETLARGRSACTAGPLHGGPPADGNDIERFNPSERVEQLLLDPARIHNVAHAVPGNPRRHRSTSNRESKAKTIRTQREASKYEKGGLRFGRLRVGRIEN